MSTAPQAIYARRGEGLSELDGQLLLDLGSADDAELEELFARAEDGRGGGALRRGGRALPALPRHRSARLRRRLQPRQLPARRRPAARGGARLSRAIKLDPGFVEAWFNLAGLMSERGRDRRGAPPSAARRSRSTPTMPTRSSISPSSNSMPAISPRRGAGGRAISNSTSDSEWARTAARGIQFVDLQLAQRSGRLRWRRDSCSTARRTRAPPSCSRMAPARRWIRRR